MSAPRPPVSIPTQSPPAPSYAVHPDAVSGRTKLAYGVGGMLDRIGNQGLKDLGNQIFNLVLGINPALIGFVFVVTRLWDAFADPLMGSVSDNARTRWGRRRPFMLVGTLLSAVLFVPVFWLPAGLGPAATGSWMLVTGLLFFTAFTIFDIPYRAFAYELAPDTHGKTRLLGYRTIFTMVTASLVSWVFPLTQSGWFGSPRESLPWIAGGLAALMLISGLAPTLFLREKPAAALAVQRRVTLRECLRRTLGAKDFRRLLVVGAGTVVGVNLGYGLGTYVIIYHIFGGNQAAASPTLGWYGTSFTVMAMLTTPVLTMLSRRFGKRDTLRLALGVALVGTAGSWWLYSPAWPWAIFVGQLLLAPGMIGLWLLGESMVADVCDVETLRSGERSEGAFSSVFAWALKTATALAILGSNLLLNLTGFNVALGAAQAPETVWRIRVLYVVLPGLGFLVSFLVLRGHRLDAAAMASVHAKLAERR